jgi:hypothetical protein
MPIPDDLIELHTAVDENPPLTVTQLRLVRDKGLVASWRLGRRIYFERGDLERWIASCRRPTISIDPCADQGDPSARGG